MGSQSAERERERGRQRERDRGAVSCVRRFRGLKARSKQQTFFWRPWDSAAAKSKQQTFLLEV